MGDQLRQPPSGAYNNNPAFARRNVGNVGAVAAVNFASFGAQEIVLTANCTLTVSGFTPGKAQWVQLHVQQDATGSRTLSIVGARTPGALGLTLSTAGGAIDLVSLFWSGSFLYASVAGLAFA